MGRAPCCDKANVKKGPWSPEEDTKLKEYIEKYGTGGNWIALPQKAGLKRCGKSCRLRWLNYLRPNIKHGEFSDEEDRIICTMFASIGSRWSIIAAHLPGRTDNDIKNYWNTKLKKKLMGMMALPNNSQRKPASLPFPNSSLQTPPFPPSQSLYKDHCNSYYYSSPTLTSRSSFSSSSCFEPFISSMPSSYSNTLVTNSSSLLQTQQNHFVGSCTSSDGSSNNHISYGGRSESSIKQEDNNNYMGFQSYNNVIANGFEQDQNQQQRFELNNYGGSSGCDSSMINYWVQKPNGYFEETPLEYVLEDVKQLINSTSSSNNNNNIIGSNSFFNVH
ncbi:hypothetical protein FNV43_RR05375 [Rhamnella rubrinervis]|uniref:Transcription factor RAX2 n=1 Tax=Rhamnella rubrinervis TaxID=2594499 RepID=A0A8K0MQL3_9ROSA|nr:hypothetical protein FNV43_RR05375 [Rhamnella rubrinervis]